MKALRLGLPLQAIALICAFALPAAAGAEIVPPSNGGANQYTEVYPTGGGNKNAYAEGDDISPGKVIGDRNVKKLKERGGEEGEQVAELAADTDPVTDTEVVVVEEQEPDDENASSGGGAGRGDNGGQGGNGGGQGQAGQQGDPQPQAEETIVVSPADTGVKGSGGFGEVVSQVFGTSGAGMGMLLPLLMLGAIAWAFVFAARQRRDTAN